MAFLLKAMLGFVVSTEEPLFSLQNYLHRKMSKMSKTRKRKKSPSSSSEEYEKVRKRQSVMFTALR